VREVETHLEIQIFLINSSILQLLMLNAIIDQ